MASSMMIIMVDMEDIFNPKSGPEAENRSCSSCGSMELTKGVVWGTQFHADGGPYLTLRKTLSATACKRCGHIDMWIDPT